MFINIAHPPRISSECSQRLAAPCNDMPGVILLLILTHQALLILLLLLLLLHCNDNSLCTRVFQLAQGVDFRLSSTGGQGKCSPRLELALLYFFQTFRRMYMWEQHGLGSVALTSIMMVRSVCFACVVFKFVCRHHCYHCCWHSCARSQRVVALN
jgi:hypothetical protein